MQIYPFGKVHFSFNIKARFSPVGYSVWPSIKALVESEAHPIAVVRVVVVVRVAARIDIVEVVRIRDIRRPLPPVVDGTGAGVEINPCNYNSSPLSG